MNILIGKLGRSVYFDPKNWAMGNGDEEAPILYMALARRYPNHKFYLVGKSDLSRTRGRLAEKSNASLSAFFDMTDDQVEDGFFDTIPDNIIDLMEGFKSARDATGINEVDFIENKINSLGIKFDVGIVFQGPSPNVGIMGRGVQTLKGDEAKTLEMFQGYYAPIMHSLNYTQVPYFLLVTDPRYVPLMQRDVFNDEKFILSQINTTVRDCKRISGYYEKSSKDNLRRVNLNYRYAAIETIFFMNEKKIDFRNMNKKRLFVMGINGAGPASDREVIIKEWLLDHTKTHPVKIYGKWRPEFVDAYPGVFEEKAIKDVEDEFWDGRYTLIPPFSKKMSNFVTQKFWKMIYYGIIPFFHPQYDTDKLFDVPSILRVNTPQEMWERIDYLENNPEEYQKILNHLYELLDDKLFDGSFMMNKISNTVEEIIGSKL